MSQGNSWDLEYFLKMKHVSGQFLGLRIFLKMRHVSGQFFGLRIFFENEACLRAVLSTKS